MLAVATAHLARRRDDRRRGRDGPDAHSGCWPWRTRRGRTCRVPRRLPVRRHPGRDGHRRPPRHRRGDRPRGRPAAPTGTVLDGGATCRTTTRSSRALLDDPDGAVVARVTPADKLRIARVLRERGHVVAMTGDGVNDAPALREADVGVAMGASGSDVAREAADLVLLDDHFATIVAAVELGRATFSNVRRFLTYHLTDNVAELAPFAVWALTGGSFPLAIGVLQVLALDIGTDMLPALALGAEPPSRAGHAGRRPGPDPRRPRRAAPGLRPARPHRGGDVADRLRRSCCVGGGWSWGETPPAHAARRSPPAPRSRRSRSPRWPTRSPAAARRRPVWRVPPLGNRLLAGRGRHRDRAAGGLRRLAAARGPARRQLADRAGLGGGGGGAACSLVARRTRLAKTLGARRRRP